jgi:hypothetical protein
VEEGAPPAILAGAIPLVGEVVLYFYDHAK